MDEPENRRAKRFEIDVSAELKVGNRVMSARTKNLSETGVCLVTSGPLEEGAQLPVSLFLTVDGIEDVSTPSLDLSASVVWASPGNDGGHMAGCHFSDLDPERVKHLQSFLSRLP